MELRAAGRPVSEESPIMSLSRGFVVEGQSNGAANNSPLVSASSKSRPQSYGGKSSNNMRKSPSHGSLRGILSMLQSGSFQRRGDSSDTDASIKPISGSDTMLSARDTGKPPSGIDISRLRTKSGKNLFKVVAEEAQSTSRSRQPSMTSDEKNARLAPRGILTSSPSTARSGGSGGEPMIFGEGIASGLLLTARPSPSLNNGAKTLEIDSVKIGSSLSYTPSVASQLCAEGNLSDSELASNATNSFDCVDDLKV